jgi:hypothetical protein
MKHDNITDIFTYMRRYASQLGSRILETYAPLHAVNDPVSPRLAELLRDPLPAQELAIMGVAKYLKRHRSAKIVAECGTGKTLMSMGAAHVHADRRRAYSALVMCPPHLVPKWGREVLITVPRARVFFIEDLRNGGMKNRAHGVVEAQLVKGKIMRRGIATSLPELRRLGRSAWLAESRRPTYFIMGKERGKLSYFWKPAYVTAKSGPRLGSVVNPDTGLTIDKSDGGQLTTLDFEDQVKRKQIIERPYTGKRTAEVKAGRHSSITPTHRLLTNSSSYSPLWQADRNRIHRMAPIEYIGRYMKHWFDYAIADEVHQLAGDTAQGNGLAVLARAANRLITLTGTMMGGYADDLFNVLYRMDGPRMAKEGFEWGATGRQDFQSTYGVIESVETHRDDDNACSRRSKRSIQIYRRPGCSPLLFGKHLMESTAFVSLEDISDQLPPYEETVIQVGMDETLRSAYDKLTEDIKNTMKSYPRDKGLRSIMLNTLLCYPDHPFGWQKIERKLFDRGDLKIITVARPKNLPENTLYGKEKELLGDVQEELRQGRRCQVFATYTGKHDVTARLQEVFCKAGIRCAVLHSTVPTEQREAWYEKRLQEGVEVVICHPRLVETGLDLLSFPTIYFYETGYSLHTLRQASRRSWRIGQRQVVRVKFFAYKNTMQETCIRLMGKKMLVALMMEGKFSGEGLQSVDADEDMLSAMARELVEKAGVGESADAIWRDLEHERNKHLASKPAPAFIETLVHEDEPVAPPFIMPATMPTLGLMPLDFDATEAADPEGVLQPVATPEPVTVVPIPSPPPAQTGLHLVFSAPSKLKHTSTTRQTVDTGQMLLFAGT